MPANLRSKTVVSTSKKKRKRQTQIQVEIAVPVEEIDETGIVLFNAVFVMSSITHCNDMTPGTQYYAIRKRKYEFSSSNATSESYQENLAFQVYYFDCNI